MKKAKILTLTFFVIVFMGRTRSALNAQVPSEYSLRPAIDYTAEGFKDPFKSYLEEEVSAEEGRIESGMVPEQPLPALNVQGIIWGGNINQAIINNKLVKVGDIIEGVKIVEINKDGIKVLFGNKQHILSSPTATTVESLKKKSEGGKDERQY